MRAVPHEIERLYLEENFLRTLSPLSRNLLTPEFADLIGVDPSTFNEVEGATNVHRRRVTQLLGEYLNVHPHMCCSALFRYVRFCSLRIEDIPS